MPIQSVRNLNTVFNSPSFDAWLATVLKRNIKASPSAPQHQTARLDGAGCALQAAGRRRVDLSVAVTQPIRQHKPSTCKPGSSGAEPEALVSRLHIPNCLEIHCKTQHVLDDSLTAVKFSSKTSLGPKPSPIDRITFPPRRHLPHASAESDLASPPPLPSRGEGTAFSSSVVKNISQGCPLPTSKHFALSATSSSTCRSFFKCLPHASRWVILLKLPKQSLVFCDRHQEIISQQSSSKRSSIVDYYWSSRHEPNSPK